MFDFQCLTYLLHKFTLLHYRYFHFSPPSHFDQFPPSPSPLLPPSHHSRLSHLPSCTFSSLFPSSSHPSFQVLSFPSPRPQFIFHSQWTTFEQHFYRKTKNLSSITDKLCNTAHSYLQQCTTHCLKLACITSIMIIIITTRTTTINTCWKDICLTYAGLPQSLNILESPGIN